jgi:hypothetical protein
MIKPRLWLSPVGYPAHHEYVRRYWTAAIGAGAVADLLRLMQAAKRKKSIRRPINTPALVRSGLVVGHDNQLWVRSTVPPLPAEMLRRLPQSLRHELAQLGQ